MDRYIDVEPMRDDWLNAVNENIFCPNDVLDSIDSQPDADVEPIRHAHWEAQEYEFLTCSKCGESYYTGYDCTPDAKEKLENGDCYNYCPHCGAKMDESVKQ